MTTENATATTAPMALMLPIARKTLARIEACGRAVTATDITRHQPFKSAYDADELTKEVLRPLAADGYLTIMVNNRWTYYSLTEEGREALAAFRKLPARPKTPGYLVSRMTGHYRPPVWPVASQRGDHRHIASRGIGA